MFAKVVNSWATPFRRECRVPVGRPSVTTYATLNNRDTLFLIALNYLPISLGHFPKNGQVKIILSYARLFQIFSEIEVRFAFRSFVKPCSAEAFRL